MGPHPLCLVCGCSEHEVGKMHCFPSILEKSKLWQESLGMKYSGLTLQNYRICSRHFSNDCYIDSNLSNTFKLKPNSVPTLYPCISELTCQVPGTSTVEEEIELFPKHIAPVVTVGTTQSPRPVRRSLFKGIQNLSRYDSTPRKAYLMNMVHQKEDHIRKLKHLCKQKAHDIKELSELSNSKVVRSLFKGMPLRTVDFLISQVRCAKRKPKGRRWTTEEKIVGLALYKRSPRCYNLLSKLVVMPSRRTLLALLECVPFHVGINQHLLKHIGECIDKEQGKYCVLLFDEMDIMEHISYDISNDKIIGYEDLGDDNDSHKFANRALVFMCQGLSRKWKQPVAYYFSNNGCNFENLTKCIKEVIHAAKHVAGLHVVATICDMGSSNVKALKGMNITVRRPYFLYEGEKIFTLFDPPHLLKCIVSLFRKYSVDVPISVGEQECLMEAKFSDIKDAYQIDKETPLIFRAMHKIRQTHLAPIMKFAMKVHIAAQIMSRTVAAFLYTLLSRGELEQRSLATATFVQQVDQLFDSFNGSSLTAPDGKDVKCCITDESPHKNFWKIAFSNVKNWVFRRFTKTGKLKLKKPPSQVGWMITIKAIQGIWNYLKNKGFASLCPRSFNQDALENFFGAIRGGCGSGDNPTTLQFVGSLKTQILNGLTNQALSGTNCEEDDNVLLSNLKSFLNVQVQESQSEHIIDEPGVAPLILEQSATNTSVNIASDIAEAVTLGNIEILSVAYVSGFIAKRLLKHINCEVCQQLLLSASTELHNQFIVYKEWSEDKKKLIYPSENLVVSVGYAVSNLEDFLPNFGGKPEIGKCAAQHIRTYVNFSWLSCEFHRELIIDSIIKGVCRIGIPWWCKRKNIESKQQRKDARATKRKLKKLQHQ